MIAEAPQLRAVRLLSLIEGYLRPRAHVTSPLWHDDHGLDVTVLLLHTRAVTTFWISEESLRLAPALDEEWAATLAGFVIRALDHQCSTIRFDGNDY